MPDITTSLPTSASPLASTSPVGEIRGVDTEISGEDAATFANLLQENLKGTPEDPIAAAAALLAGLMADEAAAEGDGTELPAADPTQLAADLLASGLVPAPALTVAEQLMQKTTTEPVVEDDSELSDLGRDFKGDTAKGDARGATAGIAAATGRPENSDGKSLPDFASALPTPTVEAGMQAQQQSQAMDFRAHLNAAQRPPTELAVATPINQQGWADDIGHQVTWLADQGSSRAELVLTPPHMGRIEISLQIGVDQSSAQFVSANPQVREALEQAMPRLREMLAGSGISLGEANVSSDHPSGERGTGSERRGRDGSAGTEGTVLPPARRGTGLVDLFA